MYLRRRGGLWILRASKPRPSGAKPLRLLSPHHVQSSARGSGKNPGQASRERRVDVVPTQFLGGVYVTYTDQVITCTDCGIDFVFSASEQEFFAEKGFSSAPKRCSSCRAQRRASGGGRSEQLRQRRRILRPRPARDARRRVRPMRQRDPGPVPPDRRATGLLLRLLPDDARLTDAPTTRRTDTGGHLGRPFRLPARPPRGRIG